LKILHLFLKVDRDIEESATQFRGFIGNEFKKFIELHHHLNSNDAKKLVYGYPKIQYKVIQNRAIVLGISKENISILKNLVLNLKKIVLGDNTYRIIEIKTDYQESEFSITNQDEMHTYKFQSPWLALNPKNYEKYVDLSLNGKRKLLIKILIGNIISMSKYLGYTIPSQIKVDIDAKPLKILFKNVNVIGFKGVFKINFLIPNYLGIGKGVSHGYGSVKKINSKLN